MTDQKYDWKRFWCPRGASIYLTENGYLADPELPYSRTRNPYVHPFQQIAATPCLVLLAEPGMGKSWTMRKEREAIDAAVVSQGERSFWMDLRSYSSEDRLVRNLFESPEFTAWESGNYRLHVFLDSLDEALLRIDTLAALLVDELVKYPQDRLSLRIACRTADWPEVLEKGLRQLWPENKTGIYELTPLRRTDVVIAAQSHNIDPEAFLQEIDRMSVGPLASKPVTLILLLALFQRHQGKLPSSQADIYEAGCRLLCEETNDNRVAARRRGSLTADERLIVAGRIAAATVFGNRFAVWTGVDRGDVPTEDVLVPELVTDEAEIGSEDAVREVLGTGLFSARGLNRLGWAHQTYAEFLAAWYLNHQGATTGQILSLLVHPEDAEGKLIPQLQEPSAWVAGMAPEVFKQILRTDPEVLLRSNAATGDEANRRALAASILELAEAEKIRERFNKAYQFLTHSELAQQLQPYLNDSSKPLQARQVAVDIAEACEVKALQDELVQLGLNVSETTELRVNASFAVQRIGDEDAKSKLKPLALGNAGDDPADDLKGCGLQATWPHSLTTDELFQALTPPKRDSYIGSYEMFLSSDFIRHLLPADLPRALNWIASLSSRHELDFTYRKPVNAIFLRAWQYLDTPGVLEAFARAALSRLKEHEGIVSHDVGEEQEYQAFRQQLFDQPYKRRQVLSATLPLLSATDKDGVWLIFSDTPLVMRDDVPWLVEALLHTDDADEQTKLAQLIGRVFNGSTEHFESVYNAAQMNAILSEEFAWLLRPVKLHSPEAEEQKKHYSMQVELQERRDKQQLVDPPPAERVAHYLGKFEEGNVYAWWSITRELSLEPTSARYGNQFEADITTLPGWTSADSSTQLRIVEAAKRYISDGDPNTDEWLGTTSYYDSALGGYRALFLLSKEAPGFLSEVTAEQWRKWAPIIYAFPQHSEGAAAHHEALMKAAYTHAPEETIRSMLVTLDASNTSDRYVSIPSKLKACWDERIAQSLLSKAKDASFTPPSLDGVLNELLNQKYPPAIDYAQSLVSEYRAGEHEKKARALIAARLLILHSKDAWWSVVWPAIQQDVPFGRELVETVAHTGDRHGQNLGELSEAQLADLYIWVAQQYPHAEDPRHEGKGFYTVGVRDSIVSWRESLLNQLQRMGSRKACTEIQRIMQELPHLAYLKWVLLEAESSTRRATWLPPSPAAIIRMTQNRDARLVQSGGELVLVLLESLRRLEEKLQGEVPAAIDLWNEVDGKYTPKDENRLSDKIKQHLEDDLRARGIVINREVVIRRGTGMGDGERTDVHVNAVIRDRSGRAFDTITVIIEVKGSWHDEVLTAMESQLVERYLKDNACRHGIYLVGWYYCPQWKRPTPKKLGSMEDLQRQLDAQAEDMKRHDVNIKARVMDVRLR